MTIRTYQVGGHVRDTLLGLRSKDIDYAVEAPSFKDMYRFVESTCKQIFLVKPEFLTIRALNKQNQAVDFVMCRKDGAYSDGRRPDSVEPGTIFDDLARRDFTVNAMALDSDGKLIDPHGGRDDLDHRVIRCVGEPDDRFEEDSLRILRAIRFCITKDFGWDDKINTVLFNPQHWVEKLESVSTERKREELHKCFSKDTKKTLCILQTIPFTWTEVFFNELWLKPTNEKP